MVRSRSKKWYLQVFAVVIALAVGWVTLSTGSSGTDQPSRVEWEGGPAYYRAYPAADAAGWSKDTFFPIGVWFESVVEEKDVLVDKEAGLNTYFALTDNSDAGFIRKHGMWAITGKPLDGAGAETVGWLISDEPDMWAGAGDNKWTGKNQGEGEPCEPAQTPCGYTVMRELKDRLPKGDGRMYYANYGKGVAMWETEAEAEKFVNGYTDIMSTDLYWYSDPFICEEAERFLQLPRTRCPRAAGYGLLMDKERKLDGRDGKRQPIYAFVEVGWPMEDGRAIEPEQVRGAVMQSLIHEARGIIYFNHNFGGPCISQHVLRDCYPETRAAVTEVNRQITRLAPVLNTQSYVHGFGTGLDTMLKERDGSYYVFAMIGQGTEPGPRTLTLPSRIASAGSVEVLFENRTVPVEGGRFEDTFASEHTAHIYKITP
ncbi:hypothetical protein [Planomonospora venezuelensis]|uniref:Uncharacterized protein n=1 Tax=Planomonospora venezuelensis TaxID=1999 RepID=A0A841CWS5_PLAVE|nr:hypothetical protein [Planomonospora venezuelensis]MBB5961273.1 hypothetical protein [Planomonospora venezuelensis]